MKRVVVIIPNLNGKNLLQVCLPALFGSVFGDFEVVVVDNGSIDGSVEYLQHDFPQVRILRNKKNLGFAKAVNQAIGQTKNPYVVLLNNDTKVDGGWLSALVKSADNHPDCGSVTSKMLVLGKKDALDGAGDKINIVGQAHAIGKGEKASGYNHGQYVLGATGGASLFKRQAIESVGLFDEDFFFYFEDVDWALRAQLLGFKSFYEPSALVYHMGGETAKKFVSLMEYLRYRNTMLLVIKNFPWQIIFSRRRFVKLPLVFLHTFYFFSMRGLFWEATKAVAFVFLKLPKILNNRFAIQGNRKVSISYLESLMEEKKLKIGSFKF